jgi:hypothetical protein
MSLDTHADVRVSQNLIEALRTFPLARTVEHCGQRIEFSPFDFHAICPRCGEKIRVRASSGVAELEDVFDAVFEWMLRPGAHELVERRQETIAEDSDA